MERLPGAISAPSPALEQIAWAWGNTSGSASPVLDSPSFNISSITDGGVGILDVTWSQPFSSATSYAVMAITQDANTVRRQAFVSTTIAATSVRLYVGVGVPSSLQDLTAGGVHFFAVGV